MVRIIFSMAVVVATASQALAGGVVCSLFELETEAELDRAAAELRAQGPEGLTAVIRSYLEHKLSAEDAAKYHRVMDQVAGQRGALVSRLYWYTDFDEAKAVAAKSGKPILSLRMLGKLTDEFSCANSRFFRTALYSNKQISDYLRDNYVLHWQSVRPVPRVTVDFGDGRKLERTLTGNSAHYVVDAAGRPLDVLPGLYGPKAFKDWLVRSKGLAERVASVNDRDEVAALLVEYHANRRKGLEQSLGMNLKLHAPELVKDDTSLNEAGKTNAGVKPRAKLADVLSVSKSLSEAPLLALVLPDDATLHAQDNSLWKKIADAHAENARLDASSIDLIRAEHLIDQREANRTAAANHRQEQVVRMIRNFEQSMSLDTVKNEFLLHRKIHQWFEQGAAPAEIEDLNEKVYAELFLTPSSDPWLGLAPQDVYSALDQGGVRLAN